MLKRKAKRTTRRSTSKHSSEITIGKLHFKSSSFWLSVFGLLLIFWLGLACIISYTVYKILDNYKLPIILRLIQESKN